MNLVGHELTGLYQGDATDNKREDLLQMGALLGEPLQW